MKPPIGHPFLPLLRRTSLRLDDNTISLLPSNLEGGQTHTNPLSGNPFQTLYFPFFGGILRTDCLYVWNEMSAPEPPSEHAMRQVMLTQTHGWMSELENSLSFVLNDWRL